MRLEAVVGGALFTTSAICSAAFGHHNLHPRHAALHAALEARNLAPTPTVNSHRLIKRNDVFNAPSWPTVDIPAGFTLAGGVQITPIPELAISTMQNGPAFQSAVAVATPAADPAQWNTEADQRCSLAIAKLNGKASNPSGMAACYNVPFLDQNKGTFEAELRIFNVSMPTGDFIGVDATSMTVTFQYQAASLQASDGKLPIKRSFIMHEKRQENTAPPGAMWPAIEISVRKYIGQVNLNAFIPGMNQSEFKTLLLPQITISATNQAGQQVSTLVSSTEASFVAGLFTSTTGSLTDPVFLLDKPAEKIAAAAQGLPTPYIVPGLSLGVFPTGLIITSIWVLFFFSAVGLGTLGRMQFRDQYRAAIRRQLDDKVSRTL